MILLKQCLSERNYLLHYPVFACDETGRKREKQAVNRINGFYETVIREITAYCGELAPDHPRILYLLDTDYAVEPEPTSDSGEIALSAVITVRLSLTLRLRPEPTRRRTLVQTWQNGFLIRSEVR